MPEKNHFSKHSNYYYLPIFGNNEKCEYPILINGPNFLTSKHTTSKAKDSFYNNLSYDYELNKGKKDFEISEIEVYRLYFE